MENIITKVKDELEGLLGIKPIETSSSYMWNIEIPDKQIFCSISLFYDNLESEKFTLSAYSTSGINELHNITNYAILPMNEIAFWCENNGKYSVLSISENLKINSISNVSKDLLDKPIDELSESELFVNAQLSMIFEGA